MKEWTYDRTQPHGDTAILAQRVLHERARRLAQPGEERLPAEELVHVVTFRSGSEHFAVLMAVVREVLLLRVHHWTRVPGAPAFITGLMNVRSHLYSIMDLACFLGLPPHLPTDESHILLVRGGICDGGEEMELALLADDRPAMHPLLPGSLRPLPATASARLQDYARGVTDEMIVLLDLDRLLSDPRIIVHEEI